MTFTGWQCFATPSLEFSVPEDEIAVLMVMSPVVTGRRGARHVIIS